MNDKCKSTDGLFEYVAPNVEKPQRKRKLPGGKIAPRQPHHPDGGDKFFGLNLDGLNVRSTKNGCPSMTPEIYDALNAVSDAIDALEHAVEQSFPEPLMEVDCSTADYARGCAFLHREFLDQREAVRFYIWRLQRDVAANMDTKIADLSENTIKFLMNAGMSDYLSVNWKKMERASE